MHGIQKKTRNTRHTIPTLDSGVQKKRIIRSPERDKWVESVRGIGYMVASGMGTHGKGKGMGGEWKGKGEEGGGLGLFESGGRVVHITCVEQGKKKGIGFLGLGGVGLFRSTFDQSLWWGPRIN